jgi:hypothetical protein
VQSKVATAMAATRYRAFIAAPFLSPLYSITPPFRTLLIALFCIQFSPRPYGEFRGLPA